MLKNYISYIQHSLVRSNALKNKKIKGTPTGTKGRQIIRPEQMGHTKFKPVEIMNTVLDVVVTLKPNTANRRR
eukprot:2182426-Heterocapsa_arctica.AAC.1